MDISGVYFFLSVVCDFKKVGRNDERATGLLPAGPDLGDEPRAEVKLRRVLGRDPPAGLRGVGGGGGVFPDRRRNHLQVTNARAERGGGRI